MKNSSNLKDTITNICGLLIALCGAVGVIISQGVVAPQLIVTSSIVITAISLALIAYFSSKNPNGSKKTKAQVVAQNEESEKPV